MKAAPAVQQDSPLMDMDLLDRINQAGLKAAPKLVAHIIAALEYNRPEGIEISVDWERFLDVLLLRPTDVSGQWVLF